MNILFIMDPLEKLDPVWDNTLHLLAEMHTRGHHCWSADAQDIWAGGKNVYASARRLAGSKDRRIYTPGLTAVKNIESFGLVVFRKEPPVDLNFLYLTYLLERAADKVPMVNHPGGIRNTNEKISTLGFPAHIPGTIITASPARILEFQKRAGTDLVIKPLNQKSGTGVFILRKNDSKTRKNLEEASDGGKTFILAQKRLINQFHPGEKRILILNGRLLAAYEKRPAPNEFRANLSLKGTFHPCEVTRREKLLVRDLRAYLLREGLYFAGIDTLNEKLLELNVTCPAGATEAKSLYPGDDPIKAWASFLERFASR